MLNMDEEWRGELLNINEERRVIGNRRGEERR